MLKSRIIGTGSHVPSRILTNHDLEEIVETTDAWIATRTGIRERRISTDESTTDMAVKAARAALKSAGISAKEVGLVVVGTVTPEMTFPSTACFIQAELGIPEGTPAFDLSAACSGFLYAMDAADRYIKTGSAGYALVVGVDRFSRLIDWKDRSTCVLFGDGAGAVVMKPVRGPRGILSSHVHSDGRQWKMLYVPGSIQPSPFESNEQTTPYLRMTGNETFKLAVKSMGAAIKEALDSAGLTPDDISLLIPHQANLRIIRATGERLKLPEDKVFMNLDKYGNTSAGSIPIALDEAARQGRIKEDDIIVFVAFGGGLTWASAAVRW